MERPKTVGKALIIFLALSGFILQGPVPGSGKEPTPNRFTAVHGYDRAPPVWMAQEMMAPSRAYHFKTKFQKGFDKLGTSD